MKKHTEKEQKMCNRIMKKAFDIMSKKGIEQVSMREIAQSIGVTKPVLYYYFKDKEDLCKHIICKSMDHFGKSMMQAYEEGKNLEELAVMGIEKQHDILVQEPKLAKFLVHLISYSLNNTRKTDKAFTEFKVERKKKLEELMSKSEEQGIIPKGSSQDIGHLLNGITSHSLLNLGNPEFVFDKDYATRMTKIVFLGIRAYYKELEEKKKGSGK
ncbi:AcrR family transcriptional regulator [Elusimicrobium posterum]|uniref:TetR/AcrR family transcriptional regulator n=1 Tax=Elusimicrobium posterum TaxID=3116653 RepID=UPI003C72F7F4